VLDFATTTTRQGAGMAKEKGGPGPSMSNVCRSSAIARLACGAGVAKADQIRAENRSCGVEARQNWEIHRLPFHVRQRHFCSDLSLVGHRPRGVLEIGASPAPPRRQRNNFHVPDSVHPRSTETEAPSIRCRERNTPRSATDTAHWRTHKTLEVSASRNRLCFPALDSIDLPLLTR
jgi:hypothetical protein